MKNSQPIVTGPAILRFLVFLAMTCGLTLFLTMLLTPSFHDDAKFSVSLIYEEPRNSVEVVTLGTSTLRKAFSPDYSYAQYGISSYNSCTNSQPAISSYYLLQDLLNLQGESLKVVMLDASILVKENKNSIGAERVAASMRPSLTKLKYLWAISNYYPSLEVVEQLIPLLRYHSRWTELNSVDLKSTGEDNLQKHFHGQNIYESIFKSNLTFRYAGKYTTKKNAQITEERERSKEDLASRWYPDSLKYFDEIVSLCNERGIKIVLVKIAASSWGDDEHDSVSLYAEERGIDFLDMSVPSVWDACGLSYDADYTDDKHANLGGSLKITDYISNYLIEHYGLNVYEEKAKAGFTSEDLASFENMVEDDTIKRIYSLGDYLNQIDNERYVVIASIKGEAADALDKNVRSKLRHMGFRKLSKIAHNESYIGIWDGGLCRLEQTATDGSAISVSGAYDAGRVVLDKTQLQPDTSLNNPLLISSVGSEKSSSSSIEICGIEQSENNRGINFVVCNRDTGIVLDTSSFDTHANLKRTSDLPSS